MTTTAALGASSTAASGGMTYALKRAADAIRRAERITVICHENPDADTLGAGLAVRRIAQRLGKEAETVCVDPAPPLLSFLPDIGSLRRAPALRPDVTVIVDAGDISRAGSGVETWTEWLEPARIVNIDHHVSNPGYGSVNVVDPAAAATCELVALLLPEVGVELDAELATLLTAGIVQDTRCFAHPNATPRTLRVAAGLVEAGAPLSFINRSIYLDKPFSALALWGRMLAQIDQRLDGRIVHASLTTAMLRETGAAATDAEGFIDLLASTRAADISVLFKETDTPVTRVSVRTTERADAVAITRVFGGGGHVRAAGCAVPEPLERARELVLAECAREIERNDAGGH